jgi:hypothetical protein
MRDNSRNRADILGALPERSPRLIIRVLKAFLTFQKQVCRRALTQRCSFLLPIHDALPRVCCRWGC